MTTDFVAFDLHEPPAVVARATVQAIAPSPPVRLHGEIKQRDPRFQHIRFMKPDGSLRRDIFNGVGPQIIALVPTIAAMAGAAWLVRHLLHG